MKNKFKLLIALTLLLSVLIPLQAFAAVKDAPNLKVFVGEKKTLTAVIDLLTDEDPDKLKITWESEQNDIAKVDSRGNVTGVAEGKAKINVIVTGDANVKASVEVEVVSTVKDLKVGKSSLSLKVGQESTINYTVLPSSAFLKDVKFKSADSKIAKVDSKGNVTAVSDGETEITVTTVDGNIEEIIKVTSHSTVDSVKFLEKDTVSMKKDTEKKLKYEVLPGSAFLKDVKFKTSASKIVTVDSDGVVTAKSPGTATVTVETLDGKHTDEIEVTVEGKPLVVTSISIEGAEKRNIFVGQEVSLDAKILPEEMKYSRAQYISSNPEVLYVSASGKVKGLKKGTATITATIGDLKDTVTFEVTSTVTGIQGPEEMTIYVGEEKDIPVIVLPATAYDRLIFIEHEGKEFVKVDTNKDTLTGLKEGTVNALFTSEDGGFTHEMKINIVGMVKSVDIPFAKIEIGLEPVVIEPVFNPTTALNKNLKYEIIGDKNIIKINAAKNEITAIKEGQVKVKVTSEDGGYTDEFTVSVEFDVKDLHVYDEDNNLVGSSDPTAENPSVNPSEPSKEDETKEPSKDDEIEVPKNDNESEFQSPLNKIFIQQLIDKTENPITLRVLEQLLLKYS